jgi:hypothetical protein
MPAVLHRVQSCQVIAVMPCSSVLRGTVGLTERGVDKTVGPEFDAVAGGGQLAGAGFLGALRFALRHV